MVLLNGYSGTGSMQVEVQTSDSASFASNVKTVAIFPLDNPTLAANGKAVACSIPQNTQRYLRLNYNVTGTISGGSIISGLVADA